MTSTTLAESYLRKASVRIRVLEVLQEQGAHSDVVREAQELVELALKGMLRFVGIAPPSGTMSARSWPSKCSSFRSPSRGMFLASQRYRAGCGRSASSLSAEISTLSPPRSTQPGMQTKPWATPVSCWNEPAS